MINNSIITREALMIRRNTNDYVQNVNREYQAQFARTGAKIGDTINVRLPNDYVVQDGPTVNPEATAERSIPLTISYRKNVPMSFSTQERTMNIDDFSERYIAPAVNALVGQVAMDAMTMALSASNMVLNTDDTGNLIAPSSNTWLRAKAILTACNAPLDDRYAVLDPMTDANTVSGMMGMFNPTGQISRQTVDGQMGSKILGVRGWMQDQTVIISQTGSYDGTGTATGTYGNYTPNGAPVTTISASASPHSSVISTSALSGTLKQGDVITIAGVNRINRVNKSSLHILQQFVVLADVASGATSIPVSPAIIPPSGTGPVPYQTVDAAPAAGAAIKLVAPAGSVIRRNLLYSKRAMTLATVDLEMVDRGVVDCGRASLDGISLRTLTYYNGSDDTRATRLDVLYGFGMLRPDWAVVVPELVE
nr:P22 phage major capsid protein family protein [Gluconacetobacter sacchari]